MYIYVFYLRSTSRVINRQTDRRTDR